MTYGLRIEIGLNDITPDSTKKRETAPALNKTDNKVRAKRKPKPVQGKVK